MGKFNSTIKSKPDTENLAGGAAYKESLKLRIISSMLTNFCKDTYYMSEADVYQDLCSLFQELPMEDKKFFAQASIYARNEFGMRSITHMASSQIHFEHK